MFFPPKKNIFIIRVHYHLILDVNGLLCIVVHLKSDEWWQPLVPLLRCGNKLVTLWPNCHKFLKLCCSRFDVGIWYTITKLNIIPIVKFIIREKLKVNIVFVWGSEKCKNIRICYLLNPRWILMLKNMTKVFLLDKPFIMAIVST
jgi:hypothetical protein